MSLSRLQRVQAASRNRGRPLPGRRAQQFSSAGPSSPAHSRTCGKKRWKTDTDRRGRRLPHASREARAQSRRGCRRAACTKEGRHTADARHRYIMPVKPRRVGDDGHRAEHGGIVVREGGPLAVPIKMLAASGRSRTSASICSGDLSAPSSAYSKASAQNSWQRLYSSGRILRMITGHSTFRGRLCGGCLHLITAPFPRQGASCRNGRSRNH